MLEVKSSILSLEGLLASLSMRQPMNTQAPTHLHEVRTVRDFQCIQ